MHKKNKHRNMAKRKKKNKGKKKSQTCPIKTVKIKYRKGELTQIEMAELCNKVTISPKKVEILNW